MASQGVQRKLAAILSADLVGYSRLMEADEAGTLERLKAARRELIDPKIAEYGGRIVKLMGDGMLVEFGSVVDAVRAAVETQRALADRNADQPGERRIEFRVVMDYGEAHGRTECYQETRRDSCCRRCRLQPAHGRGRRRNTGDASRLS